MVLILLSLSSDDSYLWVGLDGDNAVQRLHLPTLTKDISFTLPQDPYHNTQVAVSLEADPYNPQTVALSAGNWRYSPEGYGGVYIYDGATRRPTSIPPYGFGGPMIDWIQWGGDNSTIYGSQYTTIDAGGVATLKVTSSGVTLAAYNGGQAGLLGFTQYVQASGLLYSTGMVFNPVNANLVGQDPLPYFTDPACTADASLGRYYCVVSGAQPMIELWVFDLKDYTLLGRINFGALAGVPLSPITGAPTQLVRWGNAGLALLTTTAPYDGNGGLFLINGPAVNPNAPPDFTSGAPINAYASLTSLSPLQAPAGSTDITVTLTGNNFTIDSTVCLNCAYLNIQSLPTTYVSSQQLNFTIPASDLSTAGFLPIQVYDFATNLFSSNALTFAVNPPASGTETTQVAPIALAGLSMAYDAHSARLYVGTADYETAYPNSIVAIDPISLAIAKVQPVGSNPDVLSVSANGEYLYMGFASATNLTQLALPSLGSPLTWALNNPQGSPVYWAGDVQAAPQNQHTVAVNLLDLDSYPSNSGGVVVYDDNVLRPDFIPGVNPSPVGFNGLAWSSTDQILTGASASSPLSELQVTSLGVSVHSTGTAIFNSTPGAIHSDFGTGLIYSDSGKVANPTTQAVVGNYNASGLVAPDSTLIVSSSLVRLQRRRQPTTTPFSPSIRRLTLLSLRLRLKTCSAPNAIDSLRHLLPRRLDHEQGRSGITRHALSDSRRHLRQ